MQVALILGDKTEALKNKMATEIPQVQLFGFTSLQAYFQDNMKTRALYDRLVFSSTLFKDNPKTELKELVDYVLTNYSSMNMILICKSTETELISNFKTFTNHSMSHVVIRTEKTNMGLFVDACNTTVDGLRSKYNDEDSISISSIKPLSLGDDEPETPTTIEEQKPLSRKEKRALEKQAKKEAEAQLREALGKKPKAVKKADKNIVDKKDDVSTGQTPLPKVQKPMGKDPIRTIAPQPQPQPQPQQQPQQQHKRGLTLFGKRAIQVPNDTVQNLSELNVEADIETVETDESEYATDFENENTAWGTDAESDGVFTEDTFDTIEQSTETEFSTFDDVTENDTEVESEDTNIGMGSVFDIDTADTDFLPVSSNDDFEYDDVGISSEHANNDDSISDTNEDVASDTDIVTEPLFEDTDTNSLFGNIPTEEVVTTEDMTLPMETDDDLASKHKPSVTEEVSANMGDISIADMESSYRQIQDKPKVIKETVVKEIIKTVGNKNGFEGLKEAKGKIILVTGDRCIGKTHFICGAAKCLSKFNKVLCVDFDTVRHGMLHYIDYGDFNNYDVPVHKGVKLARNTTAFDNCVYSVGRKLDYLLSDFDTDIEATELEATVNTLLDVSTRYGVVFVDCPIENLESIKELIPMSDIYVFVEGTQRGYFNLLCELENLSLTERLKHIFATKGKQVIVGVNQKGKGCKALVESIRNLYQANDVDWMAMPYVELQGKTIEEMMQTVI